MFKRKKAKKMFKKLGFVQTNQASYNAIRYKKHDDFENDDIIVVFDENAQDVSVFYEHDSTMILSIDMKLLKAINQQSKELEWIE